MALERVVVSGNPEVSATGFGAAQIANPLLRDLYLYWADKWHGPYMPTRADIDPLDMPALLPMIYLVDVERQPLRFRFRLVGTRVVSWFGRDMTGQYVEEAQVWRYREVAETGRASYDRLYAPNKQGRHGSYQCLLMPLAGENGSVEMLLGGMQPTPSLI
ncbi:PAS domain-containing protein [Tistlia consotensis]|uniref:PAS domain-containing protein n=1 Tax=Tistlia consotensis USBA 355 TaxID=560819 RepID=A0A1Y6C6K5_9PROT|nr:PAS domain-containing protein [Tistlia consotensis]SMF45827.1 PAS domain-containing protein [Tistlia consotensis USBA 355]SNR79217.1 PAS domain-containing protein [Tistlia consotensis]